MLLRFQLVEKYSKSILLAISTLTLLLGYFTLTKYPGNPIVYIMFTVISNFFLFAGFTKNAIFLDAFLSVFFWLGFWLKFSLRVAFFGGIFNQQVGNFDGSPAAFDRALLVVSFALLALLISSVFRRKCLFNYPEISENQIRKSFFHFYDDHRKKILISFIFLVIFIAFTNAAFVIYQKGRITETVLPFGFNGVYKWLLLFGLASFFAWISRVEFYKKTSFLIMALGLFEIFISNVSMLSRGMILNAGAVIYGIFLTVRLNKIKSKLSFLVSTIVLTAILFITSIMLVNYIRSSIYLDNGEDRLSEFRSMTTPLFVDRWVGIEGVMAVSSYPNLGWPMFRSALKEKYDENETSFYDNTFITSSYVNTDKTKHHFISLPGIIAFFFYPGSFIFLFGSMLILSLFASLIEIFTYKFGGTNLVLCSLFAEVIAYRFSSFGYVPTQSYLLFGSMCMNLLFIYLLNRFIDFKYKNENTNI